MKKRLRKNEVLFYEKEEALALYEAVERKEYRLHEVLKDSSRSYVAHIEISGQHYVYKEPREKNRRKWQRFLSLFRKSESRREGLQMFEIEKAGFRGPKFQYAYEKMKFAMVVDSHLLYSYLPAREVEEKDLERVLGCLEALHAKGYLHGDSQKSNFLVDEEGVYLIDSKFQKNHYGALGRAYEIYYLELSCPEKRLPLQRDTLAYKLAKAWKDVKEAWVKRKTKRREKK